MSRLTIVTPIAEIQRLVLKAALAELNHRIPQVVKDIENDVARAVKFVFANSLEYISLTDNGELAKHFGLPQADAILKCDAIIDKLIDSIQVKFKRFSNAGNTITGGITIYAFVDDFKDIMSMAEANVVTNKGQSLPWLEWLLIRGDTIIITDWTISTGVYPSSRAGETIMIQSQGGLWRVPPQFSGTQTNNWITRAVDDCAVLLEKSCASAIKRNIEKAIP